MKKSLRSWTLRSNGDVTTLAKSAVRPENALHSSTTRDEVSTTFLLQKSLEELENEVLASFLNMTLQIVVLENNKRIENFVLDEKYIPASSTTNSCNVQTESKKETEPSPATTPDLSSTIEASDDETIVTYSDVSLSQSYSSVSSLWNVLEMSEFNEGYKADTSSTFDSLESSQVTIENSNLQIERVNLASSLRIILTGLKSVNGDATVCNFALEKDILSLGLDNNANVVVAQSTELSQSSKSECSAVSLGNDNSENIQLGNVNESPASTQTMLHSLRNVLTDASSSVEMLCRRVESKQIKLFITAALCPNSSNRSIYISGVPGSGKTVITKQVITDLSQRYAFNYVYVNAMMLLKPANIFVEFYKKITDDVRPVSNDKALHSLNNWLENRKSPEPLLIVIDELDQLLSKKQEILYKLFNWTEIASSRICIVSIANTLDLPERLLSKKIASRLGTNRIAFQPYTHFQIEEILKHKTSQYSECVESGAIELIARKVAAINGDLRKAINALCSAINWTIRAGDSVVDIQHVLVALNQERKSSSDLFICNLSKHEVLVFNAVVLQVRSTGQETVLFCNLYREYRTLCLTNEGFEPFHDIGIHSLVMKLCTSHLLIAGEGKSMMLQPIKLGMPVNEAEAGLKERRIQTKLLACTNTT